MDKKTNKISKQTKDVPIFILAGGLGTRISEETSLRPKPMVEIGGYPILLHIMRYYYSFGYNDFIICAGYLSKMIKEYFKNYDLQYDHLELDNRVALDTTGKEEIDNESTNKKYNTIVFSNSNREQEKWRVRVLDTGLESMTGSRLAKAIEIIEKRDNKKLSTFGLTYGDGLTNCDLSEELKFHFEHNKIGTILGVKPIARFGELDPNKEGLVTGFLEKPESKQAYINGGYFLFEREILNYISKDNSCILEREPLQKLSNDKELYMYKHDDFWACMDTMRDKEYLQSLWESGSCPWNNLQGNNLQGKK